MLRVHPDDASVVHHLVENQHACPASARSCGGCCRSSSAAPAGLRSSRTRAGSARRADGAPDRRRRRRGFETAVVVGLRARAGEEPRRDALPRRWRHRRQPAVRRIDDDRGADLAVDDGVGRAGIEPERVVAAHVSGRARRSVATFRRRRTLAGDRFRAGIDLRRHRAFDFRDFLTREDSLHPGRPLERRERGQVVGSLKIGMSVGHAPRRIRLRALTHDRRRLHSRQRQQHPDINVTTSDRRRM